MSPIDLVLSRLDRVRQSGPEQWSARCPAHEDRHPSLSVALGTDGRVLVNCHAGCPLEDICASIGLHVRDLFSNSNHQAPPPPARTPKPSAPPPTAEKRSFATAEDAIQSITSSVQKERGSDWGLAKDYPYPGADESEVMRVLRFEPAGGGAKTFRPIHPAGGRWFIGDPHGLLPLYRLPTLALASIVYVVEGEKAADAAVAIGLVATTNAHGARSAKRTDWSPLAGMSVVLVHDNDSAGRHWAVELAETLADLGATVRIVTLPDLPEHGDIVEFVTARRAAGLDDAAIRAEVESLAKAAEPVGGAEDDTYDEPEEPGSYQDFDEPRKLVEFRDGVAWMPDIELASESRRHPFDPDAPPFSSLRQLAEQVARGLRSGKYEAKWFRLHTCSIQIMARANLTERAKIVLRVWYEVVRDQVPETDHHLTYTVAADRLRSAHGEDLLWSAVSVKRIHQWDGIYWSHDQVALAQQWSDEIAQTFLAEFEKLERIADRLDRDGDRSPELIANLERRFPVAKWNSPPDEDSQAAAEKAKVAALARLQNLDLGEDGDHLCWRVNVAAFLRWRAREVEKLYRKLETPAGVEAVLEKVRYLRQRPEEDFDREPYLLVAKNCVIDLRTGEPVAPDRTKLLTKQAGAKYWPGHRSEVWEAVLDQWTGGDKQLPRWLQVIVGYSLIGLRSGGRYIIVIFGKTRTAKGTFLKIVARALGMYASPFNARAFSDTRHSSHDEDLASLRGVRFAYASEMGSARFDAEKLKSASSGDPMRPSRKGEQSFEMRPECAIWMATNDLPRIPTHDAALWDRLRFVEFEHQFALSSRGDELADDPDFLAAVLAWAVEGAVEFLRNGLPECDKVAQAIEKARGELDPLAEWYEERVDPGRVNDASVFTATASLYSDYVVHALASGERPVSKAEFGRLLGQRGVADAKNDDVRGWRLQLRTPPRSRL